MAATYVPAGDFALTAIELRLMAWALFDGEGGFSAAAKKLGEHRRSLQRCAERLIGLGLLQKDRRAGERAAARLELTESGLHARLCAMRALAPEMYG